MKKNLFNFFWIFGLISFLISCEKDFDEVNAKKPNSSYKIKVVYGENFFKEHPEIRSKLKSKSQPPSQSRMISNDYNFEIDETKVQIIETENYDVFTFKIERNTPLNNVLENYILVQYSTDSLKHFIANYPYTEVNQERIYSNDATITEISNPNLSYQARDYLQITNPNCEWVPYFSTQNVYIPGDRCGCHGNHVYGDPECDCPASPPTQGHYETVDVTTWKYECYTGGGSGSANNNPWNGDTTGGGGGSGDSSSEDILTAPFDNDNDLIIENPDCGELKTNSKDSIFRQNMNYLKTDLLTSNVEKGFQIYNGNYITPPYAENPVVGNIVSGTAQDTPAFPYHVACKALVHNHLKDPTKNHIGTFSPNDILQLFDLYSIHQQQNSPVKQTEVASYLVCNEGNYVLKIGDFNKLYLFVNKYVYDPIFKKEVDDFYKEKNIVHGKPKIDQNIGFLKLLKKYNFGVKLFEGDENFENWQELELNNSGNDITKKPC